VTFCGRISTSGRKRPASENIEKESASSATKYFQCDVRRCGRPSP